MSKKGNGAPISAETSSTGTQSLQPSANKGINKIAGFTSYIILSTQVIFNFFSFYLE
jgi:hypothetical protein